MSLSDIAIRRPVGSIVLSIAIILFGLVGFGFLGVREYPAIDPPNISVRTNYAGAAAEIIESQITEPLEKAINGIEGIKSVNSSSSLGSSNITVEFEVGSDLEKAANDVRDKVSQAVRNLPQDIDAVPTVSKADANSDPIIFMPVQSSKLSDIELSDYVENVLQEKLQTIPGVSEVRIFGQRRPAMRLWIDPLRLAAYKLTLQDITAALNRENVQLPGGKISGDRTELNINVLGKLETEEQFNNLIISQSENRVVRFRQVGEAVLGPENLETVSRLSNVKAMSLAIIPQPGANYIAIADEFYKRYEEIKKTLPDHITTDVGLDKSRFVRKSILEVQDTLIIAIILVVLIIYLFFRDWIIAFRPLIDIPVSLIGAFFIMYLFGFSINVLTLLAIVLATGLVVDDGIVVTENIFRKIEQGMDKMRAAEEGTREIFFAVISTSITLAVVFIPVIFLEGFTGRLFREFGIVVAGAVLISAVVSLTLTPVLNIKMSRAHNKRTKFYNMTEPFFRAMENGYRRSLEAFMRRRWLGLALTGICAGIIIFIGGSIKSELAPLEDRSVVRCPVIAPEGTSFDYMDDIIYRFTEKVIDSVPEASMIFSLTAAGGGGPSLGVNSGTVIVRLTDPATREATQQDIADRLARIAKKFPEARILTSQEQTISTSMSSSSQQPVQLVIQHLDFEKIRETLPKFLEAAQKDPVFSNVDANLKFNKPEASITIDRLKATNLGVNVLDISNTLQLAFSGQRFAYFYRNGKQYQAIGQLERGKRDEPSDIASLYVRSRTGQMIQLSELVTIRETSNPPSLFHYNRFKSATVSASLAPGKTLGDGIAVMKKLAAEKLDDTFRTEFAGPSRDFAESSSNTSFALILALALIYLVLAAQFESFRDPFVIMITVPLAMAGALLSLWIFGATLNIFSQIGMIMLIGLVTKNGILIVEFSNQLRAKGTERLQAVKNAAEARLRPILMTTLATVLGALPIALALGAGAKSRTSLGIVIVGGLLFSLVLTLYVIPAMYSYLSARDKPSDKQTDNEVES
ncbi:MAG: acriflavin resistance protein [Bacteroidetes bacterium]|nr:MAG: acriflavin resistance protein [Bacteroidota bacterium]